MKENCKPNTTQKTTQSNTNDFSSTYPEGFFDLCGSLKEDFDVPDDLDLDKDNLEPII